MACFLSTRSQKTEFWPILLKKKKKVTLPFLTKKHGLTPLEKCKIFDVSKWMFLYSKMASFLYKRPQNTFFWPFLLKKKKGQTFLFLTKNHARTPLKKCKILNFLNSLLI